MAVNEPERVRALIEGRPAAAKAAAAPATAAGLAPWPWWARALALLRWHGDVGVGDTVHRRLGQVGARQAWGAGVRAWDWWKGRKPGAGCQPCKSRRGRWNRAFPYPAGRGWRLPV